MARRPAKTNQADIARVLKAISAAGMQASRLELQADGNLTVILGGGAELNISSNKLSAFDEWKAKQDASSPEGH